MPDVDMQALLALVLKRGASDLHLKAGRPPILRIDGRVHYTDLPALGAVEVQELAGQIMDERGARSLRETGGADFSHVTAAGDRFRVSVYRQRGLVSVVARRVNRETRTFRDLHLPEEALVRVSEAPHGLVIFTGTTGSGKSTSIASCLEYINQHRTCHIVTLEDPIEFVFEDGKAFFDQREIGIDVSTFEEALKGLLREDPDVVLVGEMRDRTAVESVLRAAETTRLVFTTVHAPTAPRAIVRILDFFEASEHRVVRDALASNLVAVVCQKLVPSADPNVPRVPVTEVMLGTPTVRKAIRDGDEDRLPDIVAASHDAGMHDFTRDLVRLVREEWIDPKLAYEVAPNPEALKMAIRGIDVKRGTLR